MKAKEVEEVELPLSTDKPEAASGELYPTYGGIERGTMIPEPKPKQNRHVAVALNNLRKRRSALEAKDKILQDELEQIDAAILALE